MLKEKLGERGLVTNGYSLPYNPDLTERAKRLRNNMTLAEEKLWNNFMKNHKYRFRRQKQIDNYIVDFYCAKFKLVIEIDGEIHNEENRVQYDIERTQVFECYGIKVIRFSNDSIMNNMEEVCTSIDKYLVI